MLDKALAAQEKPQHDITVLYSEHHRWLEGWLRRRLGNASDAEDLMQDIFERLLGSSATVYQDLREPRAYLATVAKRLLINHLRRQSLEQAYLQALATMPEDYAPSPEQQTIILEALQQVDAMLNGLPSKVRAVFILSQVDGMSYPAIASELKIGLRSVKRYMMQAMAECILLADCTDV